MAIVGLVLLTVPAHAEAERVPLDPELRTGQLHNGLTYYVRNTGGPEKRADFHLVVKAGSIHEADSQRGLAHFLEHMAFNGTKHFPGRTLIDELERKGLRYGANINASTFYDRTIYKLTRVPTDSEEMIDKALLILYEWAAGGITNHEKDIDEERGIIREEWRTRSTGVFRSWGSDVFPVIFAGSIYANRFPIGTMEVINNFRPQVLRDFYRKWYRTDLQAVIVVGDIDVEAMVSQIEKRFAAVSRPSTSVEQVDARIPDNREPIVAVAADPELPRISMEVYWKHDLVPWEDRGSVAEYKRSRAHGAISNMLINRFVRIEKRSDRDLWPGVNAGVSSFSVAASKGALNLSIDRSAASTASDILSTLRTALTEMKSVRQFGFTEVELSRYREGAARLLDSDGHESDRPTFAYVDDYVAAFTENRPVPDPVWASRTDRELLEQSSLDSLNAVTGELITEDNVVFVVIGPRKADLPAKEEILSVWNEVRQAQVEPYTDSKENEEGRDSLTELPIPDPGKLVKSEERPFGFTEWTYANGVRVQFRRVEDRNNRVLLWGYSPGGRSAVADGDLPSAKALGSVVNGEGASAEGGNVLVNVDLYPYYEQISGSANGPEHVETLFRLVYRRMTDPKLSTDELGSYLRKFEVARDPKSIYREMLDRLTANGHPRARSLDDATQRAQVEFERLARVYEERVGNAFNFNFFVTGPLQTDHVRDLASTWLGSLPGADSKKGIINHGIRPAEKAARKHFTTAMVTPQSTVTLYYTERMPFTLENTVAMEFLTEILDLRYIENLREREGGTYRVSVVGGVQKFPVEHFVLKASFDTSPTLRDGLTALAYEEIEEIRRSGPTPEELKKVRSALLKSRRDDESVQGKDTVGYWLNKGWWFHVYGTDDSDYERVVIAMSPKALREFAEQVFGGGKLIELVMDPEEKGKKGDDESAKGVLIESSADGAARGADRSPGR